MSSHVVSVGSYEAVIGRGILSNIASDIIKRVPATKFVIIIDENLRKLYGDQLTQQFEKVGAEVHLKVIPPGERSKSRATKAEIEDWMLTLKCGRDTCLLAVGGGVIGDLGGFVAATYMRGIPYFQLPTSVLAMVDSSIGGKTGIDTPAGKNLLGAFYPPKRVYMDVEVLKTLPKRELVNGLAEAIKAGAIKSSELFNLLESKSEELLKLDLDLLVEVIYRSVQIKATVVLHDEKESGERELLNFGHTIGHAIESLMQPHLLHGECIAIGMLEEANLARSRGLLHSSHIRRLHNCLRVYGLPVRVPWHLSPFELVKLMQIDKKKKKNKIKIVMLRSIGQCLEDPYSTPVDDSELLLLLSQSISVIPNIAHGNVTVPGSKSISNRVLQLAAMGEGECEIRGLLHSEDTEVMLESLRLLGVRYSWRDHGATLHMIGCGGNLVLPNRPLYLNNAGTASRFLATLCCTLKNGGNGSITLTGNKRMTQRPIGDLVEGLRANGAKIDFLNTAGSLPIKIHVGEGLKGGQITLAPQTSSQFVSSVLLSAPFARQPVTIVLDTTKGNVVSKSYIEMTIQVMKQFGIKVMESKPFVYIVTQGNYTNPKRIDVEGDASSATYPLALAAITGGEVTVSNVGSQSLQGDAKFVNLLSKMGCTIKQTSSTTTVQGPRGSHSNGQGGGSKARTRLNTVTKHLDYKGKENENDMLVAIEGPVDMDEMTDSFLTLASIAAVARGTTRIVNIANQRVKECNRIAVMVEELTKCGIRAYELPTGIEIKGLGVSTTTSLPSSVLSKNKDEPLAVIKTHNDHRIAMAFAVLGSRIPGIVIEDKKCVEKTYPEFWDHVTQELHLSLRPHVDQRLLELPAEQEIKKPNFKFELNTSLVIIGMRGAGKTNLGMALSKALGAPFIDIDHTIEKKLGMTIKKYVEENDWKSFRDLEFKTFKQILTDTGLLQGESGRSLTQGKASIISCGGGIVETPAAFSILKKLPFVVQVIRDIDDIVNYLKQDPSRPAFHDVPEVWSRRRQLYVDASHYDFIISKGDKNWKAIEEDFVKFIKNVRGPQKPFPGDGTFFLALTFPDISQCISLLPQITKGVDALELRSDLLSSHDSSFIFQQLALLRRHTSLPIIFTVRSKGQGGAFPDEEKSIFKLLHQAIRAGCEYVDMESHWSPALRLSLIQKKNQTNTRLIASYHDPRSNGGTIKDLQRIYEMCYHSGEAEIVKVVVTAQRREDVVNLFHAVQTVDWASIPVVSEKRERRVNRVSPVTINLAMGEQGKLSRILNKVLSPVTHSLLPSAAAPGQMSVSEIQKVRQQTGLIRPLQFYLFGSPIAASPSPFLHNTGFEWCDLPHRYQKVDTVSLEKVREIIESKDFGGASVTIPLKEKVGSLLSVISPSAKAIGAINTIIKLPNGKLAGENTDWLGICRPLVTFPSLTNSTTGRNTVGLVVGAGGTARAACYALQQLGFVNERLVIHNPRTPAKGVELGEYFHGRAINVLDMTLFKDIEVAVIINTLPGKVGWALPTWLTQVDYKPIIFDVNYLPKETELSKQAKLYGLPIVRGIDMLIAQGLEQFYLWTGRSNVALHQVIEQTVREVYKKTE